MATAAPGNGNTEQEAIVRNAMVRDLIVRNSVDLVQQVYSTTITNYIAGQSTVINVPVRNVGLLKRFYIECIFQVVQSAAETHTRTAFGGANSLSQIILTDMNQQVRVSTTGWHLHLLASARRNAAFGTAFTGSDQVMGANWTGVGTSTTRPLFMQVPSPLTTVQNYRWIYEVPCAYSDTDLQGAIWANVVNSTMNLQLTVNPNFFVASTANPTQAVYQSNGADLGDIATMTINVYQNSLDQLPVNQQTGLVMLPERDLQKVYLLNNTNVTGLSAGADQQIPYANWRNFLSTFIVYDNAGVLNEGTDVNYLALQSANFTNFFKVGPWISTLMTRNKINDDYPDGTYYIDTRNKPINTLQYGNMAILLNPSAVTNSTSQLLIAYESLALQGVMNQAGSIFQS